MESEVFEDVQRGAGTKSRVDATETVHSLPTGGGLGVQTSSMNFRPL